MNSEITLTPDGQYAVPVPDLPDDKWAKVVKPRLLVHCAREVFSLYRVARKYVLFARETDALRFNEALPSLVR